MFRVKNNIPIDLWNNKSPITLTPYCLEDGDIFAAMLILPGGGYGICSNQEGEPVAGWLNSLGISAFVLNYSVPPKYKEEPYFDARRAMQFIRHHATDYQVNPEKVGVIGFSAGGHLAATLSNCFEKKNPSISDELEKLSARPSLAILSYPVITSGQFRHHGSMLNLLGTETPTNELRAEFSMEEAVHNNTPSTFLWHTADDGPVPVENTYLYAMALNKHKVPHEVHVYPNGEHGIGLASIFNRRNSHASQWRTAAEKWLYMNDF